MRCKNRKRLLKEIAEGSENPNEFIQSIMALQGQTVTEISELAGITTAHFYVLMNQIKTGKGNMGPATCEKIATALDIDPYILYRVVVDYNWKRFMEGKRQK